MSKNQHSISDEQSIVYTLLRVIFLDVNGFIIKPDGKEEKYLNKNGITKKVAYLARYICEEGLKPNGIDLSKVLSDLEIAYYYEGDNFFVKHNYVDLWNKFTDPKNLSMALLTLSAEVEKSIGHIGENLNEKIKIMVSDYVLDLSYDEHPEYGRTLKYTNAKYLKYLFEQWGFSLDEYLIQIDGLINWGVTLESSATQFITELKNDSSTTQSPPEKKETNYPLLRKYNLESHETVTVFLLDRMIMADGKKEQSESIAFVKITLNKPELIPSIMIVSDTIDKAINHENLDELIDSAINYVSNEMNSEEIKYLLEHLAKIIIADEVFAASENELLKKCCDEWSGVLGWDAYATLTDIIKVKYDITAENDNATESDKTPKTEKQIASEDQVADSATVISGKMVEVEGDGPFWNEQEFTIKRFKDNSIQVFQEDGTPMSGSVKAFLLSIIKQYSLDVEIEKKNTRTIGKKVIEALNRK